MALDMGGKRVEGGFDGTIVAVTGRRIAAELPQEGVAEGVGAEQSVQIGAGDSPICRHGAVSNASEFEQWPPASAPSVRPICIS